MPINSTRLALIEAFEAFDKALETEKGIRLRFPDEGAARNFQAKLMRARAKNREDNLEIYPSDHKLHGQSAYDRLQVRLRRDNGDWTLLILPLDTTIIIEEIE